MKELRHAKNFAKLRKVTDLYPEIRNKTRWSSTYNMLMKYQKIHPLLDQCNFPDTVVSKILTPLEFRRLGELLLVLTEFETVTKYLQKESLDINLAFVRRIFDGNFYHTNRYI